MKTETNPTAATELRLAMIADEIGHGIGASHFGLSSLRYDITIRNEPKRPSSMGEAPKTVRELHVCFDFAGTDHDFVVDTLDTIVRLVIDKLAAEGVDK